MKTLLIVLLAVNAGYSWNSCSDEPFCETIRNREDFSTFSVDPASFTNDNITFRAVISNDNTDNNLTLSISAIEGGIFRIIIDDPTNPRQGVPQTLDGDPIQVKIVVTKNSDDVSISSGDSVALVKLSPFKVTVYKDDNPVVVINDKNKMVYGFDQDDLSIAIDFSFPEATTAYGIPLHADSLELRTTGPGGLQPYRLYNVDHCCYENYIQESLYGAEPVLYAHSTSRTSGVFWLNAAQTFVDIGRDNGQVQSYFISEGGIMDIFVLTGPTFSGTVGQYVSLTGKAPLPQLFTLGYHQSRWSYTTQADAVDVVNALDENDYPFDAIWFDVDYMDGKRSFTWNYTAFPDPVGMQEYINSTGRKVILIIDPHFKVEEGYYIYDVAAKNGWFVKYSNGTDFRAEGWPDLSSWYDYTNPEAAEYYATLYSMENFVNTTDVVYVWNDMNEPEVFDGFERSWDRAKVYHYGNISNVDIHNIYGFSQVRATYAGFLARNKNTKRPFILSRSHFSGSQRYAAIWTGDNNSTWNHLQISFPMCLSMSIAGMSFCGADIGGFAGNLTEELYQRWYQAGAWWPFYRAHSTQYQERREPYLYSEEAQTRIRNAIKQRYHYLPLWYTLFYEHELHGEPVTRPMVYQYPSDSNTFSLDNQWLVGSDVLIRPVTEEGVSSVRVYFPGGKSEVWFDIDNNLMYYGLGYATVRVTMDSVPVYHRGGSILCRKEVDRPSSAFMHADPYTIYVFLNVNNEASGTLYIDDYETFEYRRDVYNYYRLEHDRSTLNISSIDAGAQYPDGVFTVQTVWLYRPPTNIKEAVIDGERRYPVSYAEDSMYLKIDNLDINVKGSVTIEFV